jgi:hypothetical protein
MIRTLLRIPIKKLKRLIFYGRNTAHNLLAFSHPKSSSTSSQSILFAFPEADPYQFNDYCRDLLLSLAHVSEVHLLRLPHIATYQNLTEAACASLVNNFDSMQAFLVSEYRSISIATYPGMISHSITEVIETDELHELFDAVTSLSAEELKNFQFLDLPIGSYLATDLSLSRKRDDIETESDLIFSQLSLYFSLTACSALQTLLSRVSFHRLAMNNSYSFNYALKALASSFGVPVVYFWSRTADPGQIAIYTNSKADILLRRGLSASPASFQSTSTIIEFCLNYLTTKLIRRNSTQMYSPQGNQSLRHQLLPPEINYITYFTSSPDELRSSDSIFSLEPIYFKENRTLFLSEHDVIRHLAEFCGQRRLTLVVRLHPRLGREARTGFKHESSSLSGFLAVRREFQGRNDVIFIDPETPICSYSLGRHSLANIFWWSTIGIELAMLGAPCLPAIADRYPGIGIRFQCFCERMPKTIEAWDYCLDEILRKPEADSNFMWQACSDFYYSVAYGFIDVRNIEPLRLLTLFLAGTSLGEPKPIPYISSSTMDLKEAMTMIFDQLEH